MKLSLFIILLIASLNTFALKAIDLDGEFPLIVSCSNRISGPNLKDAEIPKELTEMSILKRFACEQNFVFIYQQNGTADDPFDTGIYIAVYDNKGEQQSSDRYIDLNCDDMNIGVDGSNEKTSIQRITFNSANSFNVFIEISSEQDGKKTSNENYIIEGDGNIKIKG